MFLHGWSVPGRRNFVSAVESNSRCPTVTFYCRVVSWNSLRVEWMIARFDVLGH